jgi:hypothetical protein
MHDHDHNQNQDRNVDETLRALSERASLPAEPSADQQARWKQAPAASRPTFWNRGVQFMKTHRKLTTASLATAALVAFAVLLGPFGFDRNTVEAAVILESLKASLGNAIEVQLTNIGDEGVHVDGTVVVVFDSVGGDISLHRGHGLVAGIYVDAQVTGDETATEMAGADLHVQASLVEGQEWVWLKINQLPPALVQEQPMLLLVQQMTRNGVLLKMPGILEKHGAGALMSSFDADLSEGARVPPQDGGAHGGDSVKMKVEMLTDEELAQIEALEDDKEWHKHMAKVHAHHEAHGEHMHEVHGTLLGQAGDAELERLLMAMLNGQLTAAELTPLVDFIGEAAGVAEVEDRGNGLYVLVASEFPADEHDPWIEDMVLEVAYQEGVGVPWVRLSNVGVYAGALELRMLETTVETDERFQSGRFEGDGKTAVFDLSDFAGLLGLDTQDGIGGMHPNVDVDVKIEPLSPEESPSKPTMEVRTSVKVIETPSDGVKD